ncbi:MAG: mycothiol conjugate amidase Mca [Euzebyales bacterium]|jgi:mycothiol S-conjugate amidase|nr:mycothiol conjugate amidase Mca [Euzebyales bacterium]
MPELHAMFVHAHPDDESSKGAATMARYAKEGYRISVVTCTDGMAGEILNPAMDRPGVVERMVEVRAEELERALEILGVTDHFWLGYPDSGYVEDFAGDGTPLADDSFFNADLDEATGRLVRIIRDTRPDVVVTYPEDGGYPHPDHIRCHDVSVAAFHAAADPARYIEAGPPWQARKLYYSGAFNRRKVEALHDACLQRSIESPFAGWLERWDPDEVDPSTTAVDVGDFLAYRSRALLAHATQVDPDGMWFRVPDEVVREVYPWEDFVLALSLVETSTPESSLFAGLET